ncbi:Uu.00g138990.m01.CDS01 [Anthostomella pinea]|uniref:Uu.00g138990.m01.CDS01 n=1 Tax=Anthostomella pinea TaxID=933095 RepID=A0AAI8VPT6_9PEZI|nr:Uu.00g138990.m01.CDS01 [Anthostomella pinea]
MPVTKRAELLEDEELGALEDKTEALTLHSKRTERSRKKQGAKKAKKTNNQLRDLLNLPYELILDVIELLRPSDLFRLQRTNKFFHVSIALEESKLAKAVSSLRYECLGQCFRLPALVSDIDPDILSLLQIPERDSLLAIHKKPYQHILPPDPTEVCTCLTCVLRWSALCLIVDFAHWQDHLERGEPIPIIPRGKNPEWNQALIADNASIVRRAMHSPLWHALLLEAHLDSITKSISRHAANKGNQRPRFRMTRADVDSGTDGFLSRSGPASLDFPYHRDNYYMLEAYAPNRGWNVMRSRWAYLPSDFHDRDIAFVVRWAERRRELGLSPVISGGRDMEQDQSVQVQ